MKQTLSKKIDIGGRQFLGKVVSNKANKTVVVAVTHDLRDQLYKKIVKVTKRFLAHNETLSLVVGDKVLIRQTRPISKNKHFIVLKKVTA